MDHLHQATPPFQFPLGLLSVPATPPTALMILSLSSMVRDYKCIKWATVEQNEENAYSTGGAGLTVASAFADSDTPSDRRSTRSTRSKKLFYVRHVIITVDNLCSRVWVRYVKAWPNKCTINQDWRDLLQFFLRLIVRFFVFPRELLNSFQETLDQRWIRIDLKILLFLCITMHLPCVLSAVLCAWQCALGSGSFVYVPDLLISLSMLAEYLSGVMSKAWSTSSTNTLTQTSARQWRKDSSRADLTASLTNHLGNSYL